MAQHSSCPELMLRYRNKGLKSGKLSILLIGSSEFCHLLSKTINSLNRSLYKINLSIAISESIEHILNSSASLHVDFIIFLMNTSERHCIEQVERNISLVEPIYLCNKIILINGCNQLDSGNLGLSYGELSNFSQKYHLHMFHGDIHNEVSREKLAKRVVNFVSRVCGLKNGMPIVFDFPNDNYPMY